MTSSDISDTPTAERYDEGSAETFALEARVVGRIWWLPRTLWQ
jgi:hypothetical protein